MFWKCIYGNNTNLEKFLNIIILRNKYSLLKYDEKNRTDYTEYISERKQTLRKVKNVLD